MVQGQSQKQTRHFWDCFFFGQAGNKNPDDSFVYCGWQVMQGLRRRQSCEHKIISYK